LFKAFADKGEFKRLTSDLAGGDPRRAAW
jgi:hypothetical protein